MKMLYNYLEIKAKLIIVNPKSNIGELTKTWSWSPNHAKGNHNNASVHELLTTHMPTEEDKINQYQPHSKRI
jgi:hypothetical protein